MNIIKFGFVLKGHNMRMSKRKKQKNDTEYVSVIFTIKVERAILDLQSSCTKENEQTHQKV